MLYYEKINNNSDKWVLFIHGLGGSIETWKYQLEDFRSYNIIRVDLMGHGKSALVKGSADTATVKEIKAILDENG
ncbi:MAG: alpha/beta hydrolase, partial [Lachnospiraceae bacterium]|nr:alpha/beta hydrolase [Lachnospiraceae bacterium]